MDEGQVEDLRVLIYLVTADQQNKRDVEAIHELVETWARSVSERDIKGVLAVHGGASRICGVIEPLQSVLQNAYRTSQGMWFFPWAGQDGRLDLRDVRVVAQSNVARATALAKCKGMKKDRLVEFTIRLTLDLEKRDEGWIFAHEQIRSR